ncbi:MAG: hypothetical protein AB7S53_02490 [Thiomonas sp.]
MDLFSDETLGFELLAGADRCPDWTDDGWRTWYARMADLFRAHIPPSSKVYWPSRGGIGWWWSGPSAFAQDSTPRIFAKLQRAPLSD